MKKMITVFLTLLTMLILFITPAYGEEGYDTEEYYQGDVEIINVMIQNNGLPATKNSPESWINSGLVNWSYGFESPKRITHLNISDKGLTDTLDVSGLTELTSLSCSSNDLTGLNISGLTNLVSIDCFANKLTYLDVSMQSALQVLHCGGNELQTLNVSGLANLEYLSCSGNQLQTLDISGLTNLETLDCSAGQMQTLDFTGLTNLKNITCGNGKLTALDVSMLPNLQSLVCAGDSLTRLELTDTKSLTVNSAAIADDFQYSASLYNFNYETLEASVIAYPTEFFSHWLLGTGEVVKELVYTFTINSDIELTPVFYDPSDVAVINSIIQNNGLYASEDSPENWGDFVTWDNSTNTSRRITSLNLAQKALTGTLNVSGLTELQSLYCSQNALTGLDISGLTNLQAVDSSGIPVTSLKISETMSYTVVGADENAVSLYQFDYATLQVTLKAYPAEYFSHWQLGTGEEIEGSTYTFAINTNIELTPIFDYADNFSPEDVSVINSIIMNNGLVASINDPRNWDFVKWDKGTPKRIVAFNPSDKLIKGALDLRGLTMLETMDCSNNYITSIDLSGLPKFKELYCSSNRISSLMLPDGNSYMVNNASECFIYLDQFNYKTREVVLSAEPADEFIRWDIKTGGSTDKNPYTFVINGHVELTPVFKDIFLSYSREDIEVINTIIKNNGLMEHTNSPRGWEFVCWDESYPKRVVSLELTQRELIGVLDVSGLAKLDHLSCEGNPLSGLKLPGGHSYKINNAADCRVYLEEFQYKTREASVLVEVEDEDFVYWKLGTGNTIAENPYRFVVNGNIELTPVLKDVFLSYSKEDIDIINAIIQNNGLKATKDAARSWNFICWDESKPRRVSALEISEKNLTGNLDVSGLSKLTWLSCEGNSLTGLKLPGGNSYKVNNANDCLVYLTEFNYETRKAEIKIEPAEDFLNWKLGTGETIAENPYGFEVKGNVELTPVLKDIPVASYSSEDIAAINVIIQNNGLAAEKNSPRGWGFVKWDRSEPRRIVGLSLASKGLTGSLDVRGLTKLEVLDCSNNGLATIDISGLTNINELICENNPLKSLKISPEKSLKVNNAPGLTVNTLGFSYATLEATLEATPEEDFSHWILNTGGTSDINPYTFAVDTNLEITPVSTPKTISVKPAAKKAAAVDITFNIEGDIKNYQYAVKIPNKKAAWKKLSKNIVTGITAKGGYEVLLSEYKKPEPIISSVIISPDYISPNKAPSASIKSVSSGIAGTTNLVFSKSYPDFEFQLAKANEIGQKESWISCPVSNDKNDLTAKAVSAQMGDLVFIRSKAGKEYPASNPNKGIKTLISPDAPDVTVDLLDPTKPSTKPGNYKDIQITPGQGVNLKTLQYVVASETATVDDLINTKKTKWKAVSKSLIHNVNIPEGQTIYVRVKASSQTGFSAAYKN